MHRSAVVTGASSGIGRAVADHLAHAGYSLSLVDIAPLDELADELRDSARVSVSTTQGDVGDPETVDAAVEQAAELGPVGAVALNAGVLTGHGNLAKVPLDRYRLTVGTNIDGAVNGLRSLLQCQNLDPRCSAVITASSAGLIPAPHDPVYAMTKHAIVGLVRSLAAQETLPFKINCICPNGVDTPMLSAALKGGRTLLTPTEVAGQIMDIIGSGGTGEAWVSAPGIFEPFQFPANPGYVYPPVPDEE